jgi:hypothetical protein
MVAEQVTLEPFGAKFGHHGPARALIPGAEAADKRWEDKAGKA